MPVKHGHMRRDENGRQRPTPTYSVWLGMKSRCYRTTEPNYLRYGGRGIRVCDRWRNSFENFLADMGERPAGLHGKRAKYSIDRIDNDGDYGPGNCRWATIAEQNRNRSDNQYITHDGVRLTVGDWAARMGIPATILRRRLQCDWPTERVLASGPVSVKRPRTPSSVEIHGEVRTVVAWAASAGFSSSVLRDRWRAGDRGLALIRPLGPTARRTGRQPTEVTS